MGWGPGVRTGARNGRRPGRSPGCAARVIGSTSSQRKADIPAKELGYDAAVLRDAGCVEEQLRAAAPDGVDVVIDQVGGDRLKAAVAVARSGVRVALIGALAGQLGDAPAIDIDPMALITHSITLRGATL
ncbi:zinc-binding dehydrogenase [Streptomyces sp. WAC 06783]|uniref:zinc-binding dehydrogenase n=1 Tax=Streptomyces sp. WAC 06783 TaxID=2203211 RepID=UPI0021ADFAA5|nr:zinc-binding dehydrogenase [Streptomyces sp. WAC 06783]